LESAPHSNVLLFFGFFEFTHLVNALSSPFTSQILFLKTSNARNGFKHIGQNTIFAARERKEHKIKWDLN